VEESSAGPVIVVRYLEEKYRRRRIIMLQGILHLYSLISDTHSFVDSLL
jgi:hypothetical protein